MKAPVGLLSDRTVLRQQDGCLLYTSPVAGLMRTESAESVAAKMQALNDALKAHGVAEDIGIFMTLAFVSLPVIPELRLNTYGIIDVAQQKIVPAVF